MSFKHSNSCVIVFRIIAMYHMAIKFGLLERIHDAPKIVITMTPKI